MNKLFEAPKQVLTQGREAGRTLFLAGLGVTKVAADQYGKVFDNLVEKGRSASTKEEAAESREAFHAPLTNRVTDLGDQALDRVQSGVATVLNRFGIPSQAEIRELTQSIEQLNTKVEGLQPKSA